MHQHHNPYRLQRGVLTDESGARIIHEITPVGALEYAGGRYLHAGICRIAGSVATCLAVEATTRDAQDEPQWRVTGGVYASAAESYQAVVAHLRLVQALVMVSAMATGHPVARIAEAGVR